MHDDVPETLRQRSCAPSLGDVTYFVELVGQIDSFARGLTSRLLNH